MVFLGLGSNIGDRQAHLRAALAQLGKLLTGARCSQIFESNALMPVDAPADWDKPFLNMAVCGECALSPQALFAEIKAIEKSLGRENAANWAPRVIDIDILAMDDLVLSEQDLQIPHKELLNRDFAFLPLAELAPQWRYPLRGEYYQWLAADIASAKGFGANDSLRPIGSCK